MSEDTRCCAVCGEVLNDVRQATNQRLCGLCEDDQLNQEAREWAKAEAIIEREKKKTP